MDHASVLDRHKFILRWFAVTWLCWRAERICAITREIYKQKIETYVGRDPYVMKRTDFQLNWEICLPSRLDISN